MCTQSSHLELLQTISQHRRPYKGVSFGARGIVPRAAALSREYHWRLLSPAEVIVRSQRFLAQPARALGSRLCRGIAH